MSFQKKISEGKTLPEEKRRKKRKLSALAPLRDSEKHRKNQTSRLSAFAAEPDRAEQNSSKRQ